MRIEILVKDEAEGALVGFPFGEGQFIESETEEQYGILVTVELGEATTTGAQETFLNASDDVIEYAVKGEVVIDGDEYAV